jgi:hypothetical protein
VTEPVIVCPNCSHEIKLTQSLAAPLVEEAKRGFEQRLRERDAEIAEREKQLADQAERLADEKTRLEAEVTNRVNEARATIAAEEAAKAKAAAEADFASQREQLEALQVEIREKDDKLAEAQRAQAEAMRRTRELADKERELDLTIETRVADASETIRAKAKQDAEDGLMLKLRDKDDTIQSMQRQIDELKRRSEQGSQQQQGEVLEIEIETLLRTTFPFDVIEPVAKGEFGGDLVQRVNTGAGSPAGAILWETKRTRRWQDGWLVKLRADQRAANADAAIIVSEALPKDIDSFGLVDGVWVASLKCAIPVAVALRELLLSVAAARVAGEGQQTKMEMIYQYLTGPRFRQRVEALVEQLSLMQADLDRERKAMQRLWAKREQQLRVMSGAMAGMYGDLQGIAGRSINEIEALDVLLLARPHGDLELEGAGAED